MSAAPDQSASIAALWKFHDAVEAGLPVMLNMRTLAIERGHATLTAVAEGQILHCQTLLSEIKQLLDLLEEGES